ncbi:hypothetical protein PD885_03620 [Xanthomonas fragariae]|uniref:Transposase InsH N-terminal domain-containing protein n=1 Tax=Xanthomonas fragariae TaxID=48664 RepID=A0ABY1RUF5_9XANT|nr:hypothetical protein PD885_03620 [Xanthomonas fragariae]
MRIRRPTARRICADELFRSRPENQIDLRHPLSQLSQRMPWAALEQALWPHFPATAAAGGRPALPVRLMAGLLYLKHAYDLRAVAKHGSTGARRCTHISPMIRSSPRPKPVTRPAPGVKVSSPK